MTSLLLTLTLLCCGGTAFSATLSCATSEYTAAQLDTYNPANTALPNEYIFLAVDEGNKTALLESLAPDWTPTDTYTVIPGFAGVMNKTLLASVLEDPRVEIVECNSVTSIDNSAGRGVVAGGGLPVLVAAAAALAAML